MGIISVGRQAWKLGCVVVAVAGLALSGWAADFYVDVSWTGTASGTQTEPFTTIKAAVDAANAIAGTDEIDIYIAAGVYADVANGGTENYSTGGGTDGGIYITRRFINIYGGYAGWDGVGSEPGNFDWTEGSRVPRATIIELKDAGSRAFYHEPPAGRGALFDGLTFQNASHGANGGTLHSPHAVGGRNLFVNNCLFTNNVVANGAYGGAIWVASREGLSWFRLSDFVDNGAEYGGALSVNNVSPDSVQIEDCTFLGNHAGHSGGAIYFVAFGGGTGIQLIRGCHFESNTADSLGGAIMSPSAGVRVERSVFTQNAAPSGAALGGVTGTQSWGGSYYLENCLLYRNTGGYAVEQDGPRLTDYSVDILHCTIVENPGGGVRFRDRSDSRPARIRNSIIAFNGNYGIYRFDDDDVYVFSHNNVFGNTNDYFNCVADGDSIALDPEFADAGAGDYGLAKGSPCIDAGTDAGVTTDLDGVARPTREGFDMGAYEEWQVPVIHAYAPILWTDQARLRGAFTYIAAAYPSHAFIVFGTADGGTDAMGDWDQASGDLGEQRVDAIFSHTFTGLTPGATYFYRIVASNAYDLAWGPLGEFTTPLSGTTRTWTGLGADELASTPENWSGATIPGWADAVVLDSTTDKNMTWDGGVGDLPHGVASWTQTADYTGTVSFETRYPGQGEFFDFSIIGDATLSNGTWTHAENPTGNTAVNRLRVQVGGNLTLATAARIDVDLKGFSTNSGPGAPGASRGAAHGGFGGSNIGAGLDFGGACYGSITAPVDLGSGGPDRHGGGAVYLTVDGTADIEGIISANSHGFTTPGSAWAGSGGSLYLRAVALTGDGTLRADGGGRIATETHTRAGGGGGRVAVVLTGEGEDFSGFSGAIRAFGGRVSATSSGGQAGTVYLETDADDPGKGELVIDNGDATIYSPGASTPMLAGVTLSDFSRIVIAGNGRLGIVEGGAPLDFTQVNLDASGAASATIVVDTLERLTLPADFRIDGFTLMTTFAEATVEGNWTIGATGALTHREHVLDSVVTTPLRLTLNGNLTVEEGGAIDLTGRGYRSRSGPGGAVTTHGGGGYGGQGGISDIGTGPGTATYGRFLAPDNVGSGGYDETGSGLALLTVTGTTHIAGSMIAGGGSPVAAAGSGGGILLRTGFLTGPASGMIHANGGIANSRSSGGGGRVAVVLTNPDADFTAYAGRITAFGGESPGRADGGGAAGSVYLQAGDINDGYGTVIIDNDGLTRIRAGMVATELPPSAEPGWDEDLSRATFLLQGEAILKLTADVALGHLVVASDGVLDLNGYRISLGSATVDGLAIKSGEHSAASLGYAQVIDSDPEGRGSIVIPAPGTLMLIR